MVKFFKKFFYNKECYNSETVIEKLNCVFKNIEFKPYSKDTSHIMIDSIENNITNYISTLKELNNTLDIKEYRIDRVIENNIVSITIGLWFTNDDLDIINKQYDLWEEFIKESIVLVTWYNRARADINNAREYGVSMKLQPYIINLSSIMDTLIESQIKEVEQ